MKCEVIRDLIPLYEEELCSQASRELVEAHVVGCGECRALLLDQGGPILAKVSKRDGESRQGAGRKEDVEMNRKALQPFRKVKRAYNLRILIAMLLIPFLVFGYAEVSGNSLIRAAKGIYMADRYFDGLVEGDHAKAVRYLEFTGGRYGEAGVPFADARERYSDALEGLEGMGLRFTGFDATPDEYDSMGNDDGFTSGYVEVTAEWEGKPYNLLFWVSAQGKKIDIGLVEVLDTGEGEGSPALEELLDRLLVTYFPG
ncbi:MAG TPA: zf-HC2 domain-containing protein, partial [Clostridiaceae bacterium]|nr:zf-HC2 domain-containing protein [Clostridiaceae bacterium]